MSNLNLNFLEDINTKQLKQVLSNTDKPVFLDFWAPWCNPCKKMNPIIDEIESEFEDQLQVIKVNIDKNSDLASKLEVLKIPTYLLFKDGEQVDKMVGEAPKEDLIEKVEKYL